MSSAGKAAALQPHTVKRRKTPSVCVGVGGTQTAVLCVCGMVDTDPRDHNQFKLKEHSWVTPSMEHSQWHHPWSIPSDAHSWSIPANTIHRTFPLTPSASLLTPSMEHSCWCSSMEHSCWHQSTEHSWWYQSMEHSCWHHPMNVPTDTNPWSIPIDTIHGTFPLTPSMDHSCWHHRMNVPTDIIHGAFLLMPIHWVLLEPHTWWNGSCNFCPENLRSDTSHIFLVISTPWHYKTLSPVKKVQ